MSAATGPQPLPRLGALARWRSEIRAGTRQSTAEGFDDLHAAACNEVAALEAWAGGDSAGGRWFMDRAALRLLGIYRDPDPELRRLLAAEGWNSAA